MEKYWNTGRSHAQSHVYLGSWWRRVIPFRAFSSAVCLQSISFMLQVIFYLQWKKQQRMQKNQNIRYVESFTSCLFTFRNSVTNFSSVLWIPDSRNFSNFTWNHAEINGKIVIHKYHILNKWWKMKSNSRSIHENFSHDPSVNETCTLWAYSDANLKNPFLKGLSFNDHCTFKIVPNCQNGKNVDFCTFGSLKLAQKS